MPLLHDVVLDAALNTIVSAGSRLDICSSEPATYGAVAGVSLGNKTSISVAAPSDRSGGGRKVTVAAITNGSVTGSATATHYAITNGSNTIYATGVLSAPQAVVSGAAFTLTTFDIGIPDPA